MVIEPKVSLTIILQGRVMLSQEEADTLEKQQQGSGYNKLITMSVENPKNKKDKQIIKFRTRKCRNISQHLNVNKEAYLYMTNVEACPEEFKVSQWARLSKKERLEYHFQKITEDLGGISYSYKIFED